MQISDVICIFLSSYMQAFLVLAATRVAADRRLKPKVPFDISTVFLSFPSDSLENLIS